MAYIPIVIHVSISRFSIDQHYLICEKTIILVYYLSVMAISYDAISIWRLCSFALNCVTNLVSSNQKARTNWIDGRSIPFIVFILLYIQIYHTCLFFFLLLQRTRLKRWKYNQIKAIKWGKKIKQRVWENPLCNVWI